MKHIICERTMRWAVPLVLWVLFTNNTVSAQSSLETLIYYDPNVPETPESIVFDRFDNAYISLALTGEIRKVTPNLDESTLVYMPIGAPCGDPERFVFATGLTIDLQDQLYVAVSACNPANHGVWRVDKETGASVLLANMSTFTLPNGIDVYGGYIYIADSFEGVIWRIPDEGGSPEIWADDPLLKRPPGSPFPGPNGLKVFKREVYVAVSATGNIIAVPFSPTGEAAAPRIHATLPAGQGCDEFAFDIQENIYCTTDPYNTILLIDKDGFSETILTAVDGLDGPTSVAFGRVGTNRKKLYITNAAFPQFTTTFTPSLMRLGVDLPGAP